MMISVLVFNLKRSCRLLVCMFASLVLVGCPFQDGDEKQPIIDKWIDIVGTVRDTVSLDPVPGVDVLHSDNESEPRHVAVSDSSGAYHFLVLDTNLRGIVRFEVGSHWPKEYPLAVSAKSVGPLRYKLDAFLRQR